MPVGLKLNQMISFVCEITSGCSIYKTFGGLEGGGQGAVAATGAMHCSAFPGCTMGTGESSGGGTGAGEGHRISQMAAKQCCFGISQCLRENGLEIQKLSGDHGVGCSH